MARRCGSHNWPPTARMSQKGQSTYHRHKTEGLHSSFWSQWDRIDNWVRFPLRSSPFLGVALDLLVPSNSVLKIILKKCKIWWALRLVKAPLMQNTPVNFDAQGLKIKLDKAAEAIKSGSWPKSTKKSINFCSGSGWGEGFLNGVSQYWAKFKGNVPFFHGGQQSFWP